MDWQTFKQRYCCVDLETNEAGEIFAIGAQFGEKTFYRKAPFVIVKVLAEFDEFSSKADLILGHNLLHHDLPVCRAVSSHYRFLAKPVIDTLFFSPLAFPENPYHRLVKNYKLVRDSLNDPLADARLADSLFQDQWEALQAQHRSTGILSFYHYVFSDNEPFDGLRRALAAMGAESIGASKAFDLFKGLTQGKVCSTTFDQVVSSYLPDPKLRPALAYCLAWLRVAGGNSVLPPWVRLQFKDVGPVLSQLRDIPCGQPDCTYCRTSHDPVAQLTRYFGFPAFRPAPQTVDGDSLQQAIVQAAMCDKPIFAVLPTGGGKSLCYQLPALVRYQRRGVLTIVISPLQALMKDQVDNLRSKTGAPSAAALYGMLTAPERGDVLQAIQMGDIAILYVSPEQLRNLGFQKAIEHREIGCWVFDEAHCLSKWGHDFRPDYLYAARFIKEFAQKQKALLPPVQCFTATAKQDVKDEIIDYFRANLGQELTIFEGGVERDNLNFEVQTVNTADKYPRINRLLTERLTGTGGSAIIYCSTQKHTEALAEYLNQQGQQVEAFHAGKDGAEKRHIQENFINGTTRIITATNAFGMGIDKEDVRLVIHADIPGSLENYLQEAGRAGRDQQDAECVLLFDENDIDTQFKLSAASQISQRDIAQILKGLRRSKKDRNGNVVLTTGEIMQRDEVETSFGGDDYNAATKVITAVSWLERAGYIERNENRTQVFQGRPLVKNLDEAKTKIEKLGLSQRQQQRWLAILEQLINADSDDGFSADELAQLGAFAEQDAGAEPDKSHETASQRVIRTLYAMAEAGLIRKSLLLTAFIRYKVANSSSAMLTKICRLERAMLEALQEQAPDAAFGEWQLLSLRHVNQNLLDRGFADSNPEVLRLLLNSLSRDGMGLAGNKGSLTLRHRGLDQYAVKLNRGWKALAATAEKRQSIAKVVLACISARVPEGVRAAADILVEFSAEDLLTALKQDLTTTVDVKDPLAAVERALNFLHEQKIITLQKGLAVFRQAMTIQVLPEARNRRYNKGDYEPLSQHYSERIFQVHVINEYARRGLDKIGQALAFVVAYFSMDKSEFVKRYFADRKEILERATSEQAFQRIVGDLQNPEQMALAAAHENANMLILAGPGSGKTRVVVHRCGYLLKVKRVPARSILVLCFNRNAATELRRRLIDLVGDEARSVTVQTYHGFCLRLTGHVIAPTSAASETLFAGLIGEALALLRGDKKLLGIEADETRDRLLAGYRYILVDEYQDIDTEQYQLIAAIAGRSQDEDAKLSILAVGDDDQNIYQFRGANVEFIRQFQQDYQAGVHFLVENYRSSAHIIAAANALIGHNRDRMKRLQPIRINRDRKNLEPGGRWQQLDTLGRGRVQQIRVKHEQGQAVAVVEELLRLRQLDIRLDWAHCAVLAKEWRFLGPVRDGLEQNGIPVSYTLPAAKQPPIFRIREIAALLQAVKSCTEPLSQASDWLAYLHESDAAGHNNPWVRLLENSLEDWRQETGDNPVANLHTLDFLYETLADQQRERKLGKGVFVSTMHSVKGMEFSHVVILDGGWSGRDLEEQRRLFYVAMTRAREILILMQRQDLRQPFLNELAGDHLLIRNASLQSTKTVTSGHRQYEILGPKDIDLGFAGSFKPEHPIHRQLASLTVGSPLIMQNHNGRSMLMAGDIVVARLSQAANKEWISRIELIEQVSVLAMIERYHDDGQEAYRSRCKCEQWEIPMVEIVYRPA